MGTDPQRFTELRAGGASREALLPAERSLTAV